LKWKDYLDRDIKEVIIIFLSDFCQSFASIQSVLTIQSCGWTEVYNEDSAGIWCNLADYQTNRNGEEHLWWFCPIATTKRIQKFSLGINQDHLFNVLGIQIFDSTLKIGR
jgi:hypothetical protein